VKTKVAVRDIAAECGTKARGFLTIGETASGPIVIPLMIVNGREDGPALCLTAGVHATEYAPIDAVMRTMQSLDPERLAGVVIAVPVANVRMFESRSAFVSPLDGLNLNKISGGRRSGSISEILGSVLLDEIISLSRYHIDLHGGDFGEMLLPFVGCVTTGRSGIDGEAQALARLYSPGLISIATPGGKVPPFADGLVHAASQRGVVSLFAEAGENGTLEDAHVQIHVDGIRHVMQHLGMIEGTPPAPGERLVAHDRDVVRAMRAGLLRLGVRIGDRIHAGQKVAEVVNVFGDVVERVVAPGAGIAGLIWAHKVVNTGDPIMRYWVTG
jgi:uncharacterized protein